MPRMSWVVLIVALAVFIASIVAVIVFLVLE